MACLALLGALFIEVMIVHCLLKMASDSPRKRCEGFLIKVGVKTVATVLSRVSVGMRKCLGIPLMVIVLPFTWAAALEINLVTELPFARCAYKN